MNTLILAIALLCLWNPSSAQETKLISYFRNLEVKDGLPENDIKAFLADQQNGYWFRTSSSIVFYNGHDFINFEHGNLIFNLQSKRVFNFQILGNDVYVFGDAGVDKIDCYTKKSKRVFTDSVGIGIIQGYITKKGYVLVIDKKGNILQIKENRINRVGSMNGFSQYPTFQETPNNYLLISNTNRDVEIFSEDLKYLKHIQFSLADVMRGGLYKVEQFGTFELYENKMVLFVPDSVRSFHPTEYKKSERLFFSTENYHYHVFGYNRIVQDEIKTMRSIELKINLNTNYYINQISVDRSNTIVLCTNQGIILYKEPLPFITYLDKADRQGIDPVMTRRAIVETKDHKIIQVNYHRIDLYDPVTGVNKTISKNSIDGYSAVLMNNQLWIGTDGVGLYKMDIQSGKLLPTLGIQNYLKGISTHVTAINKYRRNTLLIGEDMSATTLKLYDIEANQYEVFKIKGWKTPYFTEKVSAIVDDNDSGKWICSHAGLLQIDKANNLKQCIDKNILGTNVVNHVYLQSDTTIWIATNNGLIQYHRKKKIILKKITENNGLAGNMVIAILPDAFNSIWTPTYTGLSRVDLISGRIWNYHMQDGLTDNEYNYCSYLLSSNGDIYLGGLNGYVRIKPIPLDIFYAKLNDIKLDYVILHKKEGSFLADLNDRNGFSIHRSNDRLTVSFSVMEHLSPEYVRYYYKIEGLHPEWIPLGRQNNIELSYLPTGKYTLKIKSSVIANNFNSNLLELPLTVSEYWYETKIFYWFIASIFTFSLIGFLYIRYNSIKELNKIRTSLANDIHDEIGTMLTKAIMRLELIRKKKTIDSDTVAPVENHLRDTVQSFRNVLWSLNTDNNKTEDFVGRLNLLLSEIFADTRFEFIITNLSPNIYFKKSINVKRNLLLIVKELANNTLKYSTGNLFEVVISSDGKNWKIHIADNGSNLNETVTNSGLGLLSIKKRVDAIDGKIDMSKREKGFHINVYL